MTRKHRIQTSVLIIAILPVVGYVVAHLLTVIIPPSEYGELYYLILTLVFAALLLAVPYWMIKLGSHIEHIMHPRVRELGLRDIPKDKDQLHHSR